MEVTPQGRQANADLVKGQRRQLGGAAANAGAGAELAKDEGLRERLQADADESMRASYGREAPKAAVTGSGRPEAGNEAATGRGREGLAPDVSMTPRPRGLSASGFTRGYVSAGHAAESPANTRPAAKLAGLGGLRVTGPGPIADTLRGGQ
jgi:hypothetical protein